MQKLFVQTHLYACCYAVFYSVVPTPNVTIVALNTPTVGSILSLRCDVTTEVSIDSGIDIVWMKEGAEVLRENDTNRDVISNAKLYTSYYNMTTLKLTDDNDVYHCQAIVKKNPLINNTDHYTLHVGENKIKTYVYTYVFGRKF